MIRFRSLLPLLLLLVVSGAHAQSDVVSAGPMLGPITHREATVWVQTVEAAEVQLRYAVTATPSESGAPRALWIETEPILVNTANDHIATFRLTNLVPGWTYAYHVLVDGEEYHKPYPFSFTTQPLWQWRTDPPAFTAVLGSCNYVADEPYDRPGNPYGGDYEIFETMAGMGQDLNLWLGDNVYFREVDWWSPEGLAYRHRHDRALPEMQQYLATAPNYAIWDDHDYGPNDSDRSYILKGEALELFGRYWPNPSYGLPDTPGVFYNFLFADVEFFMLDDRYHRTPNRAPEDPNDDTVLGSAQLQWLLDALQASYAPFKVVAMGGQFLNPNEVYETYANLAPAERQYILDEIERRDIWGVLFLSGDRHHTELDRMEREGTYPLYEFTSSPLTAGAATNPRDSTNVYRVDGTLVTGQRNFGTMTVEGERTDRMMTLRTYSTTGGLLWEHQIRANDLRRPREQD